MSSEMRIALEVRLYEDVLYLLHARHAQLAAMFGEAHGLMALIRDFERNAYEVTWKRPNPPRREYLYGRYPV